MRKTLSGLFLGIIVGAIAGGALWGAHVRSHFEHVARASADQELRSLSLAHQLEITSLCAGTLRLAAAGEPERVTGALEGQLASSLRRAQTLLSEGATLHGASANLRESVHRASEHYRSRDPKNEVRAVAHADTPELDEQW